MATTVEADDQPTFACRVCGRKFIKSSLEKHEPACKKLTKMQRKVFDSGKQRAAGSDIPIAHVRKAAKEREKIGGVFPRPQTHWRERHEEFIGAVSASKQVGVALKTGQPLPPPPRTAGSASTVPSGHTRCLYCGRTFSLQAAERHIEFCKEQHARKKTPTREKQKAKAAAGGGPQARQKTPGSAASRNGTMVPPGTGAASNKTPSTASSSSRRSSRPGSAAGARRRVSSVSNGSVAGTGTGPVISTGTGMMRIGGAAVGPGQQGSKLPMPKTPTKRSNSAPRAPAAATAQMPVGQNARGSVAKSSFATPKSASSTGKGAGGAGSAKGKKK